MMTIDHKLEEALCEWIVMEEQKWKLSSCRDVSQIHIARCLTVRNFIQSAPGQRYIQSLLDELNALSS